MDVGGAPHDAAGYGPNTRTIMQIPGGNERSRRDGDSGRHARQPRGRFCQTATKRGVFEVTQEPIIIRQAEYNSAYQQHASPRPLAEQFLQDRGHGETSSHRPERGDSAAHHAAAGMNHARTRWGRVRQPVRPDERDGSDSRTPPRSPRPRAHPLRPWQARPPTSSRARSMGTPSG